MQNFRLSSGQAMAAAASLLLLAACGGGGSGDSLAPTNAVSSGNGAGTSTTATSTSSTAASATTSSTSASTTTVSTTSTTTLAPFNYAAATLAVSHSGFCLTTPDNTAGSILRQFACISGDASQKWEIKAIGASYTIRNIQSNLCLRVNDAALDPALVIPSYAVQNTCDGSTNTLWTFAQSPTAGEFNVISRFSGLCLDVIASDLTAGKEIIQYTCNSVVNQPNQRWKITATAP